MNTTTLTPLQVVCNNIASDDFKRKIAEALPQESGISVERFKRTALTALQLKPELCEADRQSLYNAVISAAQMRLLPDNREGAIVVYNTKVDNRWVKKAQFQPMVGGIIKRFGEAGVLAYAVSIYENDRVEIWNDDAGQHFKHTPVVFGERGARIGAVAVGTTQDGHTYVEAMNMDDLERAMAASRSKDTQGNPVGPWKDWPDRMEQKSALHRLGRRVPITDPRAAEMMDKTLSADRELYDFDTVAAPAPAEDPAPEPGPPPPRRRPPGLDRVAAAANRGDPDAIEGECREVTGDDGMPDLAEEPAASPTHF